MIDTLDDITAALRRAEAADVEPDEWVRFRKDVINRIFGIIAPLVDDDTWDDAQAKRIRLARTSVR